MKQIVVNVSGLSTEEKQRVNEALAKITGCDKSQFAGLNARWFYAPSSYDKSKVTYSDKTLSFGNKPSTHTPQQVLEMAGMTKQGHVHADLMALYAEDAKTTDKPWELWQIKAGSSDWISCKFSPAWDPVCQFRRKPKTHIVNGVEIPDLRFEPKIGEGYHVPDPLVTQLYLIADFTSQAHSHRKDNNLCYEPTEEGKQAAILHAKAWLGIA